MDVPTVTLPPAHNVIVWLPVIASSTDKFVVTILSQPV